MQVSTKINKIKSFIKKRTNEIEKDKVLSTSSRSPVIKPNIVICVKNFSGNPIMCRQFYDTFEAAIDKNENLSNVQKFTYLQRYLEGRAVKCIEGILFQSKIIHKP